MKTLLVACALLSSTASATVLLPPDRYDVTPKNVEIRELPRRMVDKACRSHFGWLASRARRVDGCADPVARLIIVPAPGTMPERLRQCVIRHELGHVNGWGADHRGGLSLSECH